MTMIIYNYVMTISLIDMKGTNKSLLNKEFELWKKILVGDVSDNIPTCYISRNTLKNNITSDCEKFLKCTSSVFKKKFLTTNFSL